MNKKEEEFVEFKLRNVKDAIVRNNVAIRRKHDEISLMEKQNDYLEKDKARLIEALRTGIYNV